MFDTCIRRQARERPDAPAVITSEGVWSFAWLDAAIDRAAHELKPVVPAGQEPVRVDFPNEALQWVVSLALARRGIASSPASDSDCSVAVSVGGASGGVTGLGTSALQRILGGEAPPEWRSEPPRFSLGRVIRSSGTTGQVKRIGLSWSVIEARTIEALADYGPFDGPCLVDPGINTALGFIGTLAAWRSGNAVIWDCTLDDPGKLAKLKPRILTAVPFQLQRLVDGLPDDYPAWPFRIVSGGGPIPKRLNGQISARLTTQVASIYGSSEAGAIAIADLAAMAAEERAAGRVLPNVELEVVGPDGRALAEGELGEIRVRGRKIADGYLPPAEADPAFRDGWYYTRDLGRVDGNNRLLVEGRADDVMNLGGTKVLPSWIEEAALRCPGVEDAAAFSPSDAASENSCGLALVKSDGYDRDRLAQSLAEQLEHLDSLRLFVVASIPRNAMGKIDRLELRKLFTAV